jgi:sugar lactone lactonase YvrE
MRQSLDSEGWPVGSPVVFVDLSSEGLYPDGSVVDSEGGLWNAQWGAGRVARYRPEGDFDFAVTTGCKQSTCPAFGGRDLSTLFISSASRGLTSEACIDTSLQGVTYSMNTRFTGCPEPRVILRKN